MAPEREDQFPQQGFLFHNEIRMPHQGRYHGPLGYLVVVSQLDHPDRGIGPTFDKTESSAVFRYDESRLSALRAGAIGCEAASSNVRF